MLIASIISLSFAAIVYLAATIYSLLPDKSGYDVKTYAGKGIQAIGHVGVWIGLCCLVPTVIISVNPDADPTAYLVLMIMGSLTLTMVRKRLSKSGSEGSSRSRCSVG